MGKRKRKTEMEEATTIVLDFANLVDSLFLRYTGRTIAEHLREPSSRPRELPPVGNIIAAELDIPLADAYAILGLKPDAPLEDVKKNYRNLAKAFHTDKGAMNDEAMKLINRAYDRICKDKGTKCLSFKGEAVY